MSEKKLNRREFLRMGAVTAAGTILVACGPAPTPETIEVEKVVTQEVEQIVEVEKEVEKIVTATPPGIKRGGTLTIAEFGDTKTLDPHVSNLFSWTQARSQIFDQLVKLDRYTYEYVPLLATELNWEDDLTLDVTLHEGIKFHNGEDFTAEDVKYTYDRLQDPDLPTEWRARLTAVDSVEVRGPYEVVFHLKEIDGAFVGTLSNIDVLSKSVSEAEIATTPIGTGPFQFVEWKTNEALVFERNPDYWQPDLPRVDELIIKVMPQPQTRTAALFAGDVDIDNRVDLKDVARYATTAGVEVEVSPPGGGGYIMYVNLRKPYLADERVRKALLYAFDRETLCRTFLSGLAEPANTPLTRENPAFNAEVDELYPYDPEKAKELLAEAGYPDGKGLSIEIIHAVGRRASESQFFQTNMTAIGIDCKLTTYEHATWSNRLIKEKDFDVSFDGYGGGYLLPNFPYKPAHFYRPGPENFCGFELGMYPEYEEALKAAEAEPDPKKAIPLWQEVQAVWAEYLPAGFPVVRMAVARGYRDHVKDFRGFPYPEWEYAWLDK